MSNPPTENEPEGLAARLIAAQRDPSAHSTSDQKAEDPTAGDQAAQLHNGKVDTMFERLLEDERRFEERVRRLAIASWSLAFACLLLVVSSLAFLGDVRLSGRAELGEVVAILLMPVGIVAFFAALATSMTWLWRSRTPTLRAIALRLESLEQRLRTLT
jgi:hypothetical protein